VTVGDADADYAGTDHLAIQRAVDAVAARGGGTVELQATTFVLGNAVHLKHGVVLQGAGEATVLTRPASRCTLLADDTDWYDWHVDVEDPTPFGIGSGILLRSSDRQGAKQNVTKHTVVGIEGSRLLLDSQPRLNHWTTGDATAATLYPLVTGNWVDDIGVRRLAIDGNREATDNLDGNYGGCIFLQDCRRVRIEDVTARNNNGDGISWQICDDVQVINCRSIGHAGLGLHPGSGSQRPIIRDCELSDCNIGLFWCWGVKHGLAENNVIRNAGSFGISIGHRDTDNTMRHNRVYDSGVAGLLVRDDQPAARAAHRNTIEHNTFENAGTADSPGIGIDVRGAADGLVIRGNQFVNPAAGHLATGIQLRAGVDAEIAENRFENVAIEVATAPITVT
jgi:hypothetical protein